MENLLNCCVSDSLSRLTEEITADSKTRRKFLKPREKPEADSEIKAEKIEA